MVMVMVMVIQYTRIVCQVIERFRLKTKYDDGSWAYYKKDGSRRFKRALVNNRIQMVVRKIYKKSICEQGLLKHVASKMVARAESFDLEECDMEAWASIASMINYVVVVFIGW